MEFGPTFWKTRTCGIRQTPETDSPITDLIVSFTNAGIKAMNIGADLQFSSEVIRTALLGFSRDVR
jgi:hypothetical protein